jgi:hypothetical protein
MDFTSAFPHSGIDALVFSPGSTFFALVVHSSSTSTTLSIASEPKIKRRRVGSSDNAKSTVIIRASSTLQVVRSWELEGNITSLQWSAEGRYLLAISPTLAVASIAGQAKVDTSAPGGVEGGVAFVLSLDPSLEANDGSDESLGWVARIDVGLEGLVSGQWMGQASNSIILFSQHNVSAFRGFCFWIS